MARSGYREGVPDMEQQRMIGVIGSSAPGDQEAGMAEEGGKEIAQRGAVLVCGGMGGVAPCQP